MAIDRLFETQQKIIVNPIVRIDGRHPLAARLIPRFLPGRTDACILLVNHPKSPVSRSIFIEDISRTVGRSIIDAHRLPIDEFLRAHRIKALTQIWRDVVYRNHYGKERHLIPTEI